MHVNRCKITPTKPKVCRYPLLSRNKSDVNAIEIRIRGSLYIDITRNLPSRRKQQSRWRQYLLGDIRADDDNM